MESWKKEYFLYIAWSQALLAMLGSLYFSQVLHLPPCVLCWYQRITLYPLVLIIAIGIIRKDRGVVSYILPLSAIGLLISIYHNLLYYQLIPESLAPCTAGVSCTTKLIELFGFVTIPLLSLGAFVIINACAILYLKSKK